MHVSPVTDHDFLTTAAAVIVHINDAYTVWHHWSPVLGECDMALVDIPYGIREGAHVDFDSNLLRFGSTI
jgi:hypothetical protein